MTELNLLDDVFMRKGFALVFRSHDDFQPNELLLIHCPHYSSKLCANLTESVREDDSIEAQVEPLLDRSIFFLNSNFTLVSDLAFLVDAVDERLRSNDLR